MTNPQAYIFDVFGTLVDWRESVARQVSKAMDAKGLSVDSHAFADFWRGQYDPSMDRIRGGARAYVPLDILHQENLLVTLDEFGLTTHFDAAEREALSKVWERLDPWPDVVAGLTALRGSAIIAPCSNGSIALMTRLAKYASLPWDCILGADLAQTYKPQPQVYHACCEALRLDPEQVMMVAAHNGDLHAAKANGLQTAFIPRITEHGADQTIDLESENDWDRVVSAIGELADADQ